MQKLKGFMIAGLLALSLTGCATFGGGATPQQNLDAVAAGFALAEATYDSICSTATPPGFCANTQAYAAAKAAVQVAIQTAQDAISAGNGNDSASIEALIADAGKVWQTYENIVNADKATARSLGIKFKG